MRSVRRRSRKLPTSTRCAVFATLALPASLIGGAIYIVITAVSFAIFGGRTLVYPGVLGGMSSGYLLYFFKKNLALSTGAFVVIVALGAGLIVFLSRWWLAARLGDVGLITYLFEYANVKREILSADAHGAGKMDSSPLLFWIFFLLEGGLTIYAPVKIARDGFLIP